jgi:hypothetical protein
MERPCNRYVCRGAIVAWSVGPWSACTAAASARDASASANCTSLPGTQTRVVQCTNATGSPVSDSMCLSMTASSTKPSATEACLIESSCTCTADIDCGGSPWVCDPVSRACTCSSGWGGVDCTIILLRPLSGASDCSEGVVDLSGSCCGGYIDAKTGWCCPDGSDVDAAGHCCANGRVDACGVCNGTGVAVDAWGVCCSSPLPPSGMCCVGAKVDSCGVCGGIDACWYAPRHDVCSVQSVVVLCGVGGYPQPVLSIWCCVVLCGGYGANRVACFACGVCDWLGCHLLG